MVNSSSKTPLTFPTKLQLIKEKTFYKYKNISNDDSFKYLLDSLKNKYFFFSHPSQLNDPFDAYTPNDYSATEEEIVTWLQTSNKLKNINAKYVRSKINDGSLTALLDNIAIKDKDNFNILSLCTTELNEILWGTYADSYSGICLGYKATQYMEKNELGVYYIESINKNETLFIPELRLLNDKKWFFIRPVSYDNIGTCKYNVFKKNIDSIEHNIYHKKNIWSSEKEYRAIFINNPSSPIKFDQKVYYGNNTLSEIIFGYKIDIVKRKKIINLINENYEQGTVKFYEVKPNYKEYKLEKNIITI